MKVRASESLQHAVVAIVSCLAMVLASLPSLATPTEGFTESWGSAGTRGWTNTPVGPTTYTTVTNPGGYLLIRFPAQEPAFPDADTIYNSDASYTGSYQQANLQVRFRLNVVTATSDAFKVYLRAGSGAGMREWDYGLTQSGLGWSTYTVGFTWGSGWSGGTGLQADFLSDLARITAIGIYIVRPTYVTTDVDYQLDDWEYYIPEPGVFFMLGAVFLSFGAAFRRQILGMLGA